METEYKDFLAKVIHLNKTVTGREVFEAGWKAREAYRSIDPSMVLVDLQDFAKIAQRHPNVIGRPIYYAQWPTLPEGQK